MIYKIINLVNVLILLVSGGILMIIEVIAGANGYDEFGFLGKTGAWFFGAGMVMAVLWVVLNVVTERRKRKL